MTLAAGARLGPYEIVSPLGAGGMGEVYRARDTRLGREVAIKVLPAEVANDSERLRRFEQEAKAASALNHPNLLTVHDVGSHDGTAYLVTELLAGESLRERLRQGPLPPKRAVEIAGQIAKGLAAAHEKGIVHRDLKPENLFVTRDGHVKILDFGLARIDRPELADASLQEASTVLETSAGTVLGTIGYMAPEQVRGERADARSDLFSLGVVLHEMLAGANPFRRDSVVESLHAILKEEPPAVASNPSGVSSPLARVAARLLAKRADERFQTARDLAFALEALADTPAGGLPARSRPARSLRPVVLAAIAAALVAAGLITMRLVRFAADRATSGAVAATPIRSLAVLPFASLSADRADDYFSDGMTDALTTELARLPALKVIASGSAARFKRSASPPAEIAHELRVEGLISGTVVRAGERVRISAQLAEAASDRVVWAESYERAASDVLALQGEVARAIARALALELTPAEAGRLGGRRAVDPRALDEYLRGRALWTRRTEESVRQALAHFRAATELDPSFALGHAGIADAHIILAAYGWMPPREAAPIVRAAAERAIALDPAAGEPHASLGDLAFHVERDFELAARELDRAIELAPAYATAYHWRSEIAFAADRIDEAIDLLRRAVDLDPFAPTPRIDLGRALELAGHADEAERELGRAIELSPGFARPRMTRTRLKLRLGRVAEALAEARAAAESDPTGSHLALLGTCLATGGETAEARAILERLLTEHPSESFGALERIRLAAALGERDVALADLRRAMDESAFWISGLANRRVFDLEFPGLREDPRIERLLAEIRTPR